MTDQEIPIPEEVVQHTPQTEFKTYLAMVKNAVGTSMFRSIYVLKDGEEYDALRAGDAACAFFVSSVLTIFKKLESFHGTVSSTVKDLERSGWQKVDNLQPGDVIIWSATLQETGMHAHIGFYAGDDKAVSTYEGTVIEHHDHPRHTWKEIVGIYRLPDWKLGKDN